MVTLLTVWMLAAPSAAPALVQVVEQQANRQLEPLQQQVRVTGAWWPSGKPAPVEARRVRVEFSPGEDFSGRTSVRLYQNGRRYWLRVQFVRLVATAVARRPLARGRVLAADDVSLRRVPAAELAGRRPLRPDQVLGRRLRRRLSAGQVLRSDWLERPLLVRRGDRVLLRAQGPGVVVEVPARALASARVDDRLPVQNLQSGRRVVGRLRPGPVVVLELEQSRVEGEGP